MPNAVFDNSFADATKLYYEFIDNLLVVPSICVDLTNVSLENCIRKELT